MTRDEKHHYWRQKIDSWRQSSQSQRTFCAENELSYSAFSYWRKKISHAKAHDSKWLPVQVSASSATVVICLPGGIRLEVPAPALAELLPVIYRSVQDNR